MSSPANFRLIAAMPRSGSTLLLRQFNSCSDTLLMGESDFSLIHLLNFWNTAAESLMYDNTHYQGDWDDLIEKGFFPSWYNTFDKDVLRDQLYELMQKWLNPCGNKFWGCKQVLFGDNNNPLFLFDNLVKVLPGTKVTVLTRDIKSVEESCKKKFRGIIPQYIYDQREFLLSCKGSRPYITHLEYEDLTDQDTMERYFIDQGIQTDSDKLAATIAKKIQ